MTAYEIERARIIVLILSRYVAGNHHVKKYSWRQREEDKAIIADLKSKLNAHQKGENTNKAEQPESAADPTEIN